MRRRRVEQASRLFPSRASTPNRRDACTTPTCHGFTLIELSIVVFIIALLAAVTAPAFIRSYNGAVLAEAGRRFITACDYARFQAVLRQREATLHVDVTGQRYWVSQVIVAEAGEQEQTLKVIEVNPRIKLLAGQVGEEAAAAQGEVAAKFYPNGTADSLQMLWQGRERGESLTVLLDPVTGRAAPRPVTP
jgi:prepilin-type N-terminal cleavage/methylation domain-containing protein